MRKCGAPKPAPGPSLMHPPPQYSVSPPRDPAVLLLVSFPSACPAALHPRRSVFACPKSPRRAPSLHCLLPFEISPRPPPPHRPINPFRPSLCRRSSLPPPLPPPTACAVAGGSPHAGGSGRAHARHARDAAHAAARRTLHARHAPAHYAPYPPMPSPAPMYGAPAMPPPYDPSAHLAPPYMPQAMPHMPMPPAHPFAPYPMDAYRPMPPVSHPMPPVSRPRCFPRPALASPCHSLPSPPRARPRHPCCPLCRPVPILGLLPIRPSFSQAHLPGHAAAARGGGGRAEAEGGTGGEWGGGLATTASSHHLHHHAPLSPSRPIPLAAISLTSPHSLHLFIPILLTSCICPSNPSPPTPWPICPAWGRAGVQAAAPDGSWACSECGNVNYPFRSHCNRRHCGRPRPTHDTAAAAGSGGGDAAGAVKQEVCPPGLRSRAIHEVM
ncbi:unnamed protein product [Closterium sp. NIES-64]|nr:unnamed protein product [Closterium sp. NIES-64]